jgi:hypothetical protein
MSARRSHIGNSLDKLYVHNFSCCRCFSFIQNVFAALMKFYIFYKNSEVGVSTNALS